MNTQKTKAGAKIVGGAYEVISGTALGMGRGLLGRFIPPSIARTHVASKEIKAGITNVTEGLREWKSQK